MPRVSRRQKTLHSLKKRFLDGIRLRSLYVDSDSDKSLADDLDMMNAHAAGEYLEMNGRRYTSRGSYREAKRSRTEDDLVAPGEDVFGGAWLSDLEFLEKYRMTRESFAKIVALIENDAVFTRKDPLDRGRKQAPVTHQLMVLLRYLGTEGGGASNQTLRNIFGISKGSVDDYKRRAATALDNLHDKAIVWPNARERKRIAKRIEKEHQWKNCVGFMDGSLFPLRVKPQRSDAADYSGRKHAFSLSALIPRHVAKTVG
jgi:hypothetical protein